MQDMKEIENTEKIFGEQAEIVQYRKNDIVLETGRVENHVYRLVSGSIALLIINKNGDMICKNFVFRANSFFSSYSSFLTREPSAYSMLALEDTVLERISHENLYRAYDLSIEHQKNGRLIAERLFIEESNRTSSLILKTAEERYLEILETGPEVLQHIPLKYLSSYLGITPYSLSRIRKKVSKPIS